MEKLEKQPYESFLIYSDFGMNMSSDETIESMSVSCLDSKKTDSSSIVIDQLSVSSSSRTRVYARVKDGEQSKSPYKITFRCVTSSGNKWENDVQMVISET